MATFDRRLAYQCDWTLFAITLGLTAVGLLSILSGSWTGTKHLLDPLVVRQLIWLGVGLTVMTAVALLVRIGPCCDPPTLLLYSANCRS